MLQGCRSRSAPRRAGIPGRFVIAIVAATALCVVSTTAAVDPSRALWVATSAMSSSIAVQRALASAKSAGLDTIVASVPIGVVGDSDLFDGGLELLRQARETGLEVHLSLAVMKATSADELPSARDHVVYQHPEWLMVPRELASELLEVNLRSPGYFGRISRWARTHPDRVDGLYVSPLDPAAASYLADAVAAAVRRYAVDAVYLDALDFPGPDFDYSRHAIEVFRAMVRAGQTPAERVRLDRIEELDPFAYLEEFPDEWSRFREQAVTGLLESLRSVLRQANPSLTVTVDVRTDADAARREHFQNWRSWLDRGVIDRIGHRVEPGGIIHLSTDGALPLTPSRVSSTQPAGIGDVR